MLAADLLEITEESAVQLQRLHTGLPQVDRGLLASDAAGAEAHHGLAGEGVAVRGGRLRELREPLDAPVDRAREGAVLHLERVPGVEEDDLAAVVVVALIEP